MPKCVVPHDTSRAAAQACPPTIGEHQTEVWKGSHFHDPPSIPQSELACAPFSQSVQGTSPEMEGGPKGNPISRGLGCWGGDWRVVGIQQKHPHTHTHTLNPQQASWVLESVSPHVPKHLCKNGGNGKMGGNGGKRGKPGKLGITQKNGGNGDLLQIHPGKYVKMLQEERKMKGGKRGLAGGDR